MKPKVINGVSFYEAAAEGKTEAQFIEENKHHFDGDEEKLKLAYATLTKKAEDPKTEKPARPKTEKPV